MMRFVAWISQQTGYIATFYFCCFNQDDKDAIVRGAKGRFDVSHAMTGRELCALLHIDYDELCQKRKSQQSENLKYYLAELLKINEVRQHIRDLFNRS